MRFDRNFILEVGAYIYYRLPPSLFLFLLGFGVLYQIHLLVEDDSK